MTCRMVVMLLSSSRAPGEVDLPSTLRVVDPACGEGDMLLAMAEVLNGLDRSSRTESRAGCRTVLHGVDVQTDVLKCAEITLSDVSNDQGTGLKLFHGDALSSTREWGWDRHAPWDGYDCVVGNPPYVRHESIRDPLEQFDPSTYKDSIRIGLEARFPGLRIDRRADLALLFTLLGLSLLAPRGVLGFVLPTALFDARYGRSLVDALRIDGRNGYFFENATSRSFSSVAVNTGVFLIGPGGHTGEITRLRRYRFADPDGGTALLLLREEISSLPTQKQRGMRVPNHLEDCLKCRRVPLCALGHLRYPVKTGLNAFFYVTDEQRDRFGIEAEFLVPVLKSPRDASSISFTPMAAQRSLFVCDRREEALEEAGKGGSLAYIRWGATQRLNDGTPWPEVPSLRSRPLWYSLSVPRFAHLFCPRFFDRRFLFVEPHGSLLEDQTFYGLILNKPEDRRLIAAVLNSSLVHVALETHGRSGLGDGVRQYALCDMAELPVPDPRTIGPEARCAILDAYASVSVRPLLPVPAEYEQPDRIALDAAVGAAFGLNTDFMAKVREFVVKRVDQRSARAKSKRGFVTKESVRVRPL